MIYTTLLLSLAANALWITPGYQKFIAPRYKRVELGVTEYGEPHYDEMLAKHPDAKFIKTFTDGDFSAATGMQWHRMEQTNWFNRKPFTCLLCMAFWFGLWFYSTVFIHSLLVAVPLGYADTLSLFVAPFAVSFLAVLINRLFNALPVKL